MDVGQITPGDAFDEWLAERDLVDRFHPLRLKLRVPRAMPSPGEGGVEPAVGAVAAVRRVAAGQPTPVTKTGRPRVENLSSMH